MKSKLRCFLSFVLILLTGIATAQSIQSFNFENGSLDDSDDNTNSLIQTGNNLTLETGRSGLPNHAVKLNGDILTSQNSQNSTFDEYSVSLWIKTSTNDILKRSIVDMYGGIVGGEGPLGFQIYLENGDLKIDAQYVFYNYLVQNDYGLGNYKVTIGHPNIDDGEWHHIVLRTETSIPNYNPVSIYRLYVDGEFSDALTMGCSLNISHGPNSNSPVFHTIAANQQLKIGHDISDGFHPYEDYVDDVKLFDYLIDGDEIQSLYNRDPRRVYVDANATGDNSGSSWNNAITDLQTAIDNSVANDSLWIKQGIYTPSISDRSESFTFPVENINVYGGFDGSETELDERDWKNDQTILSGDLNGNDNTNLSLAESSRNDNSYSVINLTDASNITLDGLVVSDGHANLDNSTVSNYRGAAIYADNSNNITMRNLIVENNVSIAEGAVRFFNGIENNSTFTVESCIFRNNLSTYSSSLTFITSEVSFNNPVNQNVNIYNSLFYNNTASDLVGSTRASFSGSSIGIFTNNLSTQNVSIVNNTFTENKDFGTGSADPKATIVLRRYGIWSAPNDNGDLFAEVYNNIFTNNYDALNNVAAQDICLMNFPNRFLNELSVKNNRMDNDAYLTSLAIVPDISNNLQNSPNFVNSTSDIFRLQTGSPLIDAGDNSYLPASISEDLDGNNRIVNSLIDLGAYEHDPSLDYNSPTAIAQDIITQLDANGNATIALADIDNGSTDDQTSTADLILSLDQTTFDCSNIGQNTVMLTVEDEAGNIATDTAIVTVEDITAPNAITQDITVQLDANGQVNIQASDIDNGSTDNCNINSLSLDITNFDCSSVGQNTVTLTLEDDEGNTTTETAIVTVEDNIDPSLSTQDITVDLAGNSAVTITPADILDSVSDNCTLTADLNLTLDQDTFNSIGTFTVTITATDNSGNTTSETADVTVDDTMSINAQTLQDQVKIYPNPAISDVTIETNNVEIKRVDVFDLKGKKVLTSEQRTFTVNKLMSGMYILKIYSETSRSVIIKRLLIR